VTFTVTFGWWLVPFVATLVAYGSVFLNSKFGRRDSYIDGLVDLILYGIATIASLAAWLVWALMI
jgi:hypothetical protein